MGHVSALKASHSRAAVTALRANCLSCKSDLHRFMIQHAKTPKGKCGGLRPVGEALMAAVGSFILLHAHE